MKAFEWLFLSMILVAIPSCSRVGDVAVTGSSQLTCESHTGCLSIVRGHSQINAGGTENYLYVMIICPDVKNSEVSEFSSGINGNPTSKAEIDYSWTTPRGKMVVPVFWNTSSENVTIGNDKFSRTNGNVFTIIRRPNGKLETKQCGTLQSHADYKEAVHFVRERCPTDKIVSSAKFYGVND